jgi:hypothetical protein
MFNCIRLILCFFLIGSVVVIPPLSAQENANPGASTIVIPFEWKKGERRTYLITTVEERSQSAKKSTKRLIEVLVAEESDESVLLKWKLGITTPEAGSPGFEAIEGQLRREDAIKIVDQVNDVFQDLILEVNVGKDSVYREIRNWEEVDNAVEKLKVILKKVVEEIDLDQDKKDRIWNAVMVRQGTRESIERKMTEELQVMLNVTASEFSLVDTEPFEEMVPYMNTLLPAFAIFKVKSIDPAAKTIEISYTRDLNQKEAAKILMEVSTKLATDLGKQPPAKGAFDQIEVQTRASYLVESETGWPVKISYENNTTNGKDSSTRKTTIELKSK